MIVYDCIPSSDLLHDIAIEDGHRNLNCDFSIFFPFNMVIFCSNVSVSECNDYQRSGIANQYSPTEPEILI